MSDSSQQVTLTVRGMSCASCVGHVQHAIEALPGVAHAAVNLATMQALVTYTPTVVSPSRIVAAVREVGYQAEQESEKRKLDDVGKSEHEVLRRQALVAVVLAALVVVLAMVPMVLGSGHHPLGGEWSLWSQAFLATVVQIYAGRRFYRLGWAALRHLAPDMNALVMLGSSAAYLYSLLALLLPSIFPAGTAQVYFEASATIVAFILVGRLLEAKSRGRAAQTIERLLTLAPRRAHVTRDGEEQDVDATEVVPGDVLRVLPGERLPVDGVVIAGNSYIDESMLTGESMPVAKESGATVCGGTVNTTGTLSYRATRVGEQTVLAQIGRMVARAQLEKPRVQETADKIARWFVPAVVLVAALTALVWLVYGPSPALSHALVAAVSVLVVACPCAMGLATPAAIMVASGKAAELGVVFRRGTAIESLARADAIVLDKTGTITSGAPVVESLVTWGIDEQRLLSMAAAVEAHSEHPIAQAVVSHAKRQRLVFPDVSKFEAIPGRGVTAAFDGQRLDLGSARFMQERQIDMTVAHASAASWSSDGKTLIYVAFAGNLVGLLAVADPVKPTSRRAVAELRALGLRVVMLTGDNVGTASSVARQVGIDTVVADALPGAKVDAIRALQASGSKVTFVGDGINDGPALTQANVGLAMGSGTELAVEAADAILMTGDLRGVVNAIALARRAMRTITLNFVWAYGYNIVLVPVAAGVLYAPLGILLSPMMAAAAMSLSSVFVLGNSLRLRHFRPARQLSP